MHDSGYGPDPYAQPSAYRDYGSDSYSDHDYGAEQQYQGHDSGGYDRGGYQGGTYGGYGHQAYQDADYSGGYGQQSTGGYEQASDYGPPDGGGHGSQSSGRGTTTRRAVATRPTATTRALAAPTGSRVRAVIPRRPPVATGGTTTTRRIARGLATRAPIGAGLKTDGDPSVVTDASPQGPGHRARPLRSRHRAARGVS